MIHNTRPIRIALLLFGAYVLAAGSGTPRLAAQQPPAARSPERNGETGAAAVRADYTKFEYLIPVRDGVKLFTSVYVPKDVFSDGRTYPIMLLRTQGLLLRQEVPRGQRRCGRRR